MVEGSLTIVLTALFFALRYYVFEKIETPSQLELISVLFLSSCWALMLVTVFSSPNIESRGTTMILACLAGLIFYRDGPCVCWVICAFSSYIFCRQWSGKPLTNFDWSLYLAIFPMFLLILRVTINAGFRALLQEKQSQQKLLAKFSTTVSVLEDHKSKLLVAQQNLLANQAHLNGAISAAPLLICQFDKDGKAVSSKGKSIHETGLGIVNIRGKHFSELFARHPDLINALISARKGRSMRVRVSLTANSVHELLCEPMKDFADSVVGVLLVGLDVSESVETERQKLNLQQQLFHSQKLESLGMLAGGVAHDFNNYLMAIVAFSDSLLCDDKLTSETVETIDMIRQTSMQAADICTQMLIYSGKQNTEDQSKSVFAINELLKDLQPFAAAIVSKKVELKWSVDPNADIRLFGNQAQIQQAMINVIKNANDAVSLAVGPAIEIRVGQFENEKVKSVKTFGDLDPDADYFQIEIRDNGEGIKPEIIENILDLYFTTKPQGHGFGMAVVARIINDHAGLIQIESVAGQTVVRLVLPQSVDPAVNPATRMDLLSGMQDTNRLILLVDDEEIVLESVKTLLTCYGFSVLSANSPAEAIEHLTCHKNNIDCLILDYSMPEMNGLELLGQIRELGFDQPAILCSGFVEFESNEAGDRYSPDVVLRKPFRPAQITNAIDRVCSVRTTS